MRNFRVGLALLIGLLLAGCNSGEGSDTSQETNSKESSEEVEAAQPQAEAILKDPENNSIGTVSFLENGEQIKIEAQLEGLEPGHHGFHIHENGVCEADAPDGPFTTAGGHFNPDGKNHPDHAGDMPSLYVNDDGSAEYSAVFDRVTINELKEGKTVVLHAGPDNFGNIPDRYQAEGNAGPDEETVKAGDAGDREACGVITSTER